MPPSRLLRHRVQTILALALLSLTGEAEAQVTLVADGRAWATIVVPDEPLPVVEYAAKELQYHVAKATGVSLAIVSEKEAAGREGGRVLVGPCAATREANIDPDALQPEQSVIKTVGRDLFLVGGDGDGDPLSEGTPAGTLFAVYELLDSVLGVRWLWPGELGIVVPKTSRVVVPATDRVFAPKFFQRHLRHGLSLRRLRSDPAYTKEGWAKFKRDLFVWLRRHRMGRSKRLRWGHSFNKYWDHYGTAHPEYFQLLEDRGRGPTSAHARFSMCVSNSELHRLIINRWRRGTTPNINLCENDINALCACRHCRSWDGPDVEPITRRYSYRCVSDRYAQFWRTVHGLASKFDPNVIVTAYAYVNYAPPPQTDVKLNDQVIVGLVPDIFFPRTPKQHRWVLDQWAGWARTGARIFLRPNYFLDGYCMPYIFVHQFAEEYDFDVRHNMAATDFDSLTSQFGTQGVNLYYLARKLSRTDASVDEVLGEYYAGFGPAGAAVKDYFDYWEKHLMANRERFAEISKELSAGWSRFPKKCHLLFPPETIAEGRRLLEGAYAAAATDHVCRTRIEFLQKGLTHAEKCTRLAAAVAGAATEGEYVHPSQCVAELRQYRRQVERDHVSNLNYCLMLEDRAFGELRDVRYMGQPLKALVAEPSEAERLPHFPARGQHGFVALLGKGEHFRAHIRCRRIGRYENPCDWRLFGPDSHSTANGRIEPNRTEEIDVRVTSAGVYNLVVDSGRNLALVTLLNKHAAIMGNKLCLLGTVEPMFVYVPQGTRQFTIDLDTPAPGETAQMTVRDPSGREVAKGFTGERKRYTAKIKVGRDQAGKAFAVEIGPAPTGVTEDLTLRLDRALPPYWAVAADRLVVPAGR